MDVESVVRGWRAVKLSLVEAAIVPCPDVATISRRRANPHVEKLWMHREVPVEYAMKTIFLATECTGFFRCPRLEAGFVTVFA
jgi:hypothetical protein